MSISLPNYTKKLLIILFFFVYVSCDKKVSFKDKKIEVVRFEKLFYNSDSADLNQIKNKYPFFFPDSYPDSVWLNRLQDPIQREIFNEITTQYDSVIFLETGLFKFFKRHKELIDKFTTPKVITVNTDIDYRNKVILADSLLLIGLDNYLGPNHKFYDGIPEYIKEDFTMVKDIDIMLVCWIFLLSDNLNFYNSEYYQLICYKNVMNIWHLWKNTLKNIMEISSNMVMLDFMILKEKR